MPRFKVFLFESIHEKGTAVLRDCCDLHYAQRLDQDYLVSAVKDMDAIIVRANGVCSRAVIEAAPRLKVIGRHGVGLDTIDLVAAAERQIPVVNTPEANDISVAEAFFGLAFALAKRSREADRAVRQGDWGFRSRLLTASLWGKTLGIYGFGKIGQATGRMGHFGFAMPIVYASSRAHPDAEKQLGAIRVSPEELFAQADFISINLPLLPSTRGLINEDLLCRMKPTAYLVNMARGQVWVEEDVADALRHNLIAGAATDVYETEPPAADNPLLALDNFVCSPHNASHTEQGMINMSMVAADVVAVLQGREPKYPVIIR